MSRQISLFWIYLESLPQPSFHLLRLLRLVVAPEDEVRGDERAQEAGRDQAAGRPSRSNITGGVLLAVALVDMLLKGTTRRWNLFMPHIHPHSMHCGRETCEDVRKAKGCRGPT